MDLQQGEMRVEPEPNQTAGQAPPGADPAAPAETEHWSPFSTSRARWAWGLMALFTVIYFVVAVATSAEFADFAATMIGGLPLGFYLGIGLIISGLVITRVYLAKIER
jgi:putative solute:sodium symporter small subunit